MLKTTSDAHDYANALREQKQDIVSFWGSAEEIDPIVVATRKLAGVCCCCGVDCATEHLIPTMHRIITYYTCDLCSTIARGEDPTNTTVFSVAKSVEGVETRYNNKDFVKGLEFFGFK